jgi:hypothetical protein
MITPMSIFFDLKKKGNKKKSMETFFHIFSSVHIQLDRGDGW